MMGRIERIGDATLYLGDARDVLPTLQRFDVVVTDPPYGIAYETGHRVESTPWQGQIDGDADCSVRDSVLALVECAALVFGSRKVAPPDNTRQVLIWNKGPALGMGALDIPWKPSFEEIYVIGRGWQGNRDEGSVIYCPPVQSMAKNGRVHPNEKPVALIVWLLPKCPEGLVLDPFMGSGTVGVACAAQGRSFIGVEVDERYFDIACERIDNAYRQQRLFA